MSNSLENSCEAQINFEIISARMRGIFYCDLNYDPTDSRQMFIHVN